MQALGPTLEDVTAEYVLIQAWKKTVSHIRVHNWFADTLELDQATANLPAFIADLAAEMRSPETWRSSPIRIVPAPKVQRWVDNKGDWKPAAGETVKLRPLAHVALRDQVAATAIMMCIADIAETAQGDPRSPIDDAEKRQKISSYGNRLFCDGIGVGSLQHRWGTTTTYRAYFQDYRKFLERPEVVAVRCTGLPRQIAVVQTDLRQFYDRVRPDGLHRRIAKLIAPNGHDTRFLRLVENVLDWTWHEDDVKLAKKYASEAGIEDFDHIALPQGLVSAGFFANIALLQFDAALRSHIDEDSDSDIQLHDYCRYVDDLRLVFSLHPEKGIRDAETKIVSGLSEMLDEHAPGMKVSLEKTKLALFRGDERPLIRQSRRMARIQSAVSGGFDAAGGEEIIDAVQGLVRTQQRYSEREAQNKGGYISPFVSVPDVADGTVSRFAAARFRSTFRSLRPLLEASGRNLTDGSLDMETDGQALRRMNRNREELDDEARSFAYGLIESWVEDPSNVRLLRIGFDIWPAADILDYVLKLLESYTLGRRQGDARRVALYCLSEILRAGATETGFVHDQDCLPKGVDVFAYRQRLKDEAVRLLSTSKKLPWYLKQQAYLFLSVFSPGEVPPQSGGTAETKDYHELIRFLRGEKDTSSPSDFATRAVVARRSMLDANRAISLVGPNLTSLKLSQIASRDPAFAAEIAQSGIRADLSLPDPVAEDLCLVSRIEKAGFRSLADLVLGSGGNPLRNEIGISSFLHELAKAIDTFPGSLEVLTPPNVHVATTETDGFVVVEKIELANSQRNANEHSIYSPPEWTQGKDRWRFQVGYLLRFILTGRRDFTETVRPPSWRDRNKIYRATKSHWYQRLHGFYNGHEAFGDDWLPVSDSLEAVVFDLLAWPGCRGEANSDFLHTGIAGAVIFFEDLLKKAWRKKGPASGLLFLKLPPPKLPATQTKDGIRPLRGCVVQLAIPGEDEVKVNDLKLSGPEIRLRHRNHLATAIAAVEQAIRLRETHKAQDSRLDWLLLPELSVHPDDVRTHLIPFARAHKAIIFAGMAYEEIEDGLPLVNSAKWIIPSRTPTNGLRMIIRRQGKQHLAKMEQDFNDPDEMIRGFRPCQWLVPYPYLDGPVAEHLWLSGSICYDATDLALPTDLRDRSDIFAISALNMDVGTFDHMAMALHYHMYQMVVIANNGSYGGSNAYLPKKDNFKKQIFHSHGQPQASVSFFEIDDPMEMSQRVRLGTPPKAPVKPRTPPLPDKWKYPPAGMKRP